MEKRKSNRRKYWGRAFGIALSGFLFIICSMASYGFYSLKNFYKMYVDGIIMLLTVAPVFLVMFIAGIEKDFFIGFRLAFPGKKGVSRIRLQRSLKAFGYVERTMVLAAVISLVFPMTDIFYHMENFMALGPSFGVLSLSILYPAVFILILTPVKIRLERRVISYMEEPEDAEEERKEAEGQRLYFGLRSLGLTDREAEVARLAAGGMTNAEIGQTLYISTATVKKHMTHVLEKAQCADREALAEKVKRM